MTAFARVADLAAQIRGVTYAKEDATSSPRPGYLPVLRAGNISDDGLVCDDLVFVPAERIAPTQKIRRNDVVIAASSGSLDVVGKAARALADFDGGFGAFCKVLRPGPGVDPGYFAHFFRTPAYRQRVSALAAGASINNLRNEHLDEFRIPLPPLPEQRRIAEILDKADALRAKRRAALAQLDTLTQSIFLDMFGDPATNPKGWRLNRLDELCEVGSSKRVFVEELVDAGVPFYRGTEIGKLGEGQDVTPSLFITTEHFESLKAQAGVPSKGDLLLPSICPDGRIYMATDDKPFYFKDARVLWIKVDQSRIDSTFLKHYLKRLFVASYSRLASGTTFAELKIVVLKGLGIPAVPRRLQQSFAELVESIERQEVRYRTQRAELDSLFASLQYRAFRGELLQDEISAVSA